MNNYKYFAQYGNQYQLKPQFLFVTILAGFVLFFGLKFALFLERPDKALMWLGIVMIVGGALCFLRLTAKITIDMDARELLYKKNFMTSEVAYSFDQFENFRVFRTISFFGLTMNASASMIFNNNGKEKNLMIYQSVFTVRPLNNVINEAMEIMGLEN